ncbi:RNA-directed DNA polymerase, eukaryota, reverse transcriptase zinc-binding domain protein, partial [Tanacetum coccineum]
MSGEQEEVASGEANNSGIGHVPCTSDNYNTDNDTNAQFKEFAKESNVVNSSENDKHATYAQTVTKSLIDDGNNLFTIPASVNSKGEEVMLFDEELVMEGYEKWKLTDPEVVIEKETHCKIPVWIRLYNVPLEAWSIKGISAISIRLGRPIMMDQMTSDMCKKGSGRLGYARVLVKVDAGKEYLEKIEINYVDAIKKVKMTKW